MFYSCFIDVIYDGPGLVGGKHVAGDGGVELQPDLVSLLVDVPGRVERTFSGLKIGGR